jgi:hypothetical protein
MHPCQPPDNDDSQMDPTEWDETQTYIDARYVSVSEAFARIKDWPTHRVCVLSALAVLKLMSKLGVSPIM